MYGHTILVTKPTASSIDFVLVMQLHISMYDFDDAPVALK